MKKKLLNAYSWAKARKYLVGGAVLAVLIIGVVLKVSGNGSVDTVSPVQGDLIRTVKIAGKVIPRESVELGFETSGTVSSVPKLVGDQVTRGEVLARLDSGEASANLQKANAELNLALAELAKLEGSGTATAQVGVSKQAIIQTIKDAYAASEDAVYNKTDQFILNPNSSNPVIGPTFDDIAGLNKAIRDGRVSVGYALDKWKTLVSKLSVSTYTDTNLLESKQYLSQVSAYISNVSRAVSLFEADNVFSQSTIDSYKSDTTSARNNLNTASQNLLTDENSLKGILQDVPAQVARVEAARASVSNFQSQLSKGVIVAPISGIVSKQDAKVGQVVSSGSNIVSIISRDFEVEAFIPEVLIAGVVINNITSISLDAYPGINFEGRVVRIDPAETVRDGVSSYRTYVVFVGENTQARSGMTADIEIITYLKPAVTLIPERAVVRTENGETFVYVLDGKTEKKVAVTVGEKDSKGNIELLSHYATDLPNIIINPTVE